MSEQYGREYFIPANFRSGISFMGKTFSFEAVLEAAVLALLPLFVFFFILPHAGIILPWDTASSVATFLSALLGYLGITGINGYTVFRFIQSILRYRKNRRVCYFNPRIKTEASPYSISNIAAQMLPREKLQEFYKKAKKSYDEKQRRNAVSEQKQVLTDRGNMFFSDDRGVVATPVEYMDRKEYSAYRKKQRREARIERRKQRQMIKAERRAENSRSSFSFRALLKRTGVSNNNDRNKPRRAADRQIQIQASKKEER